MTIASVPGLEFLPTERPAGPVGLPRASMANPVPARPHVLMITEGAYPCYGGGVAVWCDQIISGLPNLDFTVIGLVADPQLQLRYRLPPNVVAHHHVALWGIRELLETRPALGFGEIGRRRERASEAAVQADFVSCFGPFLAELYGEEINVERLSRALHNLHRLFLAYDFDTLMQAQSTWDCFAAMASECFPAAAAISGHPRARFTLGDLTEFMNILYRWLTPIASPLPRSDVVHAVSDGLPALAGIVAKLWYGTPFLLTEHGVHLRERYLAEATGPSSLLVKLLGLRFSRRVTELSYLLADQVAPGSRYNQRWELRLGAPEDRVQTIYNGVDPLAFTAPANPGGASCVVVWLGRITPLKDLVTLLQAARLVGAERPDIEFRIHGSPPAGDETYHATCRRLQVELGLEGSVDFRGHTPDVEKAFGEGDIVVLSSISEGFPYAIVEAMLCARPIVATAVGGVPEAIEGCGITVEPRNPSQMARAILELADDPARRLAYGRLGRERAIERFNLRQCSAAYEESYRRLIQAGPLPIATGPDRPKSDGPGQHSNGHGASVPAPDAVKVASLAHDVSARVSTPIDSLEVAAVVESMGVNDQVAADRYRVREVFQLAELVLDWMRWSRGSARSEPSAPELASPPAGALTDLLRGPLALASILVLLLIMAAYRDRSRDIWGVRELLALSLGVTSSVMVTNCFLQGMARRINIFLGRHNHRAARRYLAATSAIAAAVVALTAALFVLVTRTADLFTVGQGMIFTATFVGLSTIWMLGGLLMLVQRPLWQGVGLAAGLAVGAGVDGGSARLTTHHLAVGSVVGFVVAVAVMVGPVAGALRRPGAKPGRPSMPAPGYLMREALPYVAYGGLYMVLLFLPHLIGWMGTLDRGQSRLLAGSEVEVGFTLALVPLIMAGGIAERTARLFWSFANRAQATIEGGRRAAFGAALAGFYLKHLARYLLAVLGTSIACYGAYAWARQAGLIPREYAIASLFVGLGMIGYLLLAWGLFNTLFAMSLSRPAATLRALAAAIGVTLVIGLPLSLGVSYRYAAVAFIAGTTAFGAVSFWELRRRLGSAAYYYYSSF